MRQKKISQLILIYLLLPGIHMHLWSQEFPQIRILSVHRVFDNGEHNAFTDLCRYNGRYYLTFRSCPDGHGIHPTSSIIILTSTDYKIWHESFRFHVAERDTRDPHFFIF